MIEACSVSDINTIQIKPVLYPTAILMDDLGTESKHVTASLSGMLMRDVLFVWSQTTSPPFSSPTKEMKLVDKNQD